jgi:hypothetical protein
MSAPGNCAPALPPPDARPALASRRRTSTVEVILGNGRTLKVDESIDPAALARLVDARTFEYLLTRFSEPSEL